VRVAVVGRGTNVSLMTRVDKPPGAAFVLRAALSLVPSGPGQPTEAAVWAPYLTLLGFS